MDVNCNLSDCGDIQPLGGNTSSVKIQSDKKGLVFWLHVYCKTSSY